MTPKKYLLILFTLALTLCFLGWVAFALGGEEYALRQQ